MCSICSTNVTKNPRSAHTQKLKAKYFTTELTLKIGCEILRGPTEGSVQAFKGQVYTMKQYLSKQKTGNLCIILYPSNLLLAIILLICTIFRALLMCMCILISKEIIMT